MKALFAAVLLSSVSAFAAPSLNLSVSGSGLILQTAVQSCTDVSSATVPPTRSVQPGAARWGEIKLSWDSADRDLYIGQLKITVKSPKLPGGQYTAVLDSTEIEFMFGLTNSTVQHSPVAGSPVVLSSASATKGTTSSGLPAKPCALSIGGLQIDENQGTFTADAEISMVGIAVDPQGKLGDVVIRESTTSTLTYY